MLQVWDEFYHFHAGCWASQSAKFSPDGTLLPLPDKYVPENFKEWGRTMHEWQASRFLGCFAHWSWSFDNKKMTPH